MMLKYSTNKESHLKIMILVINGGSTNFLMLATLRILEVHEPLDAINNIFTMGLGVV